MLNRFTQLVVSVFALTLLSACATTGNMSITEKQAMVADVVLPEQPEPGMGMLYVLRPDFIGAAVRFKVYVDGRKDSGSYIGWTYGGQYITVPLAPGDHTLNSKAENWAEASFSIQAGESVFFQQTPRIGILFAGNNIKQLDELDAKVLFKKHNMNIATYVDADGKAIGDGGSKAGESGNSSQ